MRVLIVEDSENDAELLLLTLRRAGYAVTSAIVDTPAEMRAAIASQNWDVITSDHSMPQFSAPEALALANELCPDVPLIIVSGEIDLNLAVSLIRAGAKDFIQKRELPLLIPAIEHELREVELRLERKQMDAALIESDQRYRLLFQSIDSGFALHEIICDAQGVPCDYRFLEINPAFEKLTGLKAETLIGHTNQEMLPGTENVWIERYGKVALTGEATHFENYSGVLGKYYEVYAYSPKPGQFAVIFHDITDRKRNEEALRASEERALRSESRLKKAQAIAQVGDWIWNIKEGLVEWSDEMYRIFGIDKKNYTGRLGDVIARVIHPDDLHIVQPSNASAFAQQKKVEYRIIWPDGSIRTIIASTGDVLLDQDGSPVILTGTCQDITERKWVEETLKESEKRYRALVEWTPEPMIVHREGKIIYVNPAAIKVFGAASAQDLLGTRTLDRVHPDFHPQALAWASEITEDRPGQVLEARLLKLDGAVMIAEVQTAMIIYNEELAFHTTIRDIPPVVSG
jgi:PAS domain S-box-containing protein